MEKLARCFKCGELFNPDIENCINNCYAGNQDIEQPKVPESILSHAADYKNRAWQSYTLGELGNFVHLLAKRATHRENEVKRNKDLYDAQNYLNMMQSHLDFLKTTQPVVKGFAGGTNG